MEMLYLNNTGSRWVVRDENNRNEKLTFTTKSGKQIERRVKYFEQWGNHAYCAINYKNRLIKVFPDSILND